MTNATCSAWPANICTTKPATGVKFSNGAAGASCPRSATTCVSRSGRAISRITIWRCTSPTGRHLAAAIGKRCWRRGRLKTGVRGGLQPGGRRSQRPELQRRQQSSALRARSRRMRARRGHAAGRRAVAGNPAELPQRLPGPARCRQLSAFRLIPLLPAGDHQAIGTDRQRHVRLPHRFVRMMADAAGATHEQHADRPLRRHGDGVVPGAARQRQATALHLCDSRLPAALQARVAGGGIDAIKRLAGEAHSAPRADRLRLRQQRRQ